MALPGSSPVLSELRTLLERVETHAGRRRATLPFGVAAIDHAIPSQGLVLGQVHEFIEAGAACRFAGIAALFVAGIAARLKGPVLWCLRGRDLFAPALSRVGLHPDRVIFCETWKDSEVLPAMEEGLGCRGLGAVIGEVNRFTLTASRRLQIGAEKHGVTALVIRRWWNANERAHVEEPNAAMTRWRIAPSPSPSLNPMGLTRPYWQVDLIRARGGEPSSWLVEACDAKGRLALPASVVDRQVAAHEHRRAATG